MRLTTGLSLLALTAFVAPATAQTIIMDNSSPVVVSSISEFQTDFNTVGGMKVSWTLSPSGGSTALWGDISGASSITGAWGIWTNNLKIWGTGTTDTFGDNVWNFWGNGVTSVTMEALFGNSVFDVLTCSNAPCSTENSQSGKVFKWNGGGPSSQVTYSQPVAVSPNAFIGDLYGTLKIEFGSYQNSCPAGYSASGNSCRQKVYDACSSGYAFNGGNNKCVNTRYNWLQYTPNFNWVYANPISAWVPASVGSNKCDGSKDPRYNQPGNSGDNTKCLEQFSQDMDNLGIDQPGGPQEVVPEPATMTLLATGLVGLAAASRRKRAAK
jgi:hypothetical protein